LPPHEFLLPLLVFFYLPVFSFPTYHSYTGRLKKRHRFNFNFKFNFNFNYKTLVGFRILFLPLFLLKFI
jgi:hypothetical protein